MNADNQTYVIFFLGLALIIGIWTGRSESIVTGLIGALAGMFMGKTMNEHANEFINDNLKQIITDTVKEVTINILNEKGVTDGTTNNGESY